MVFPSDNSPQFGKGTKLGGSEEYFPFEFSKEYKDLLHELVSTDLRPWSDGKKLEFWRKETGNLIKKEKLNPSALKKRLGLVTEISPNDLKLSHRALVIKKVRDELSPQGLAQTLVAGKECLKIYHDAFKYFIKNLQKIPEIKSIPVKIIPRGIVGSFAEGNARLGIHPLGVAYEEARNENFALKRREQRGVEFPSDVDFKVVFEIGQGKSELALLLDREIEKFTEEVFTEYGVFIQVDRQDVRNAVSVEGIEKSGGLMEFYLAKKKERGE